MAASTATASLSPDRRVGIDGTGPTDAEVLNFAAAHDGSASVVCTFTRTTSRPVPKGLTPTTTTSIPEDGAAPPVASAAVDSKAAPARVAERSVKLQRTPSDYAAPQLTVDAAAIRAALPPSVAVLTSTIVNAFTAIESAAAAAAAASTPQPAVRVLLAPISALVAAYAHLPPQRMAVLSYAVYRPPAVMPVALGGAPDPGPMHMEPDTGFFEPARAPPPAATRAGRRDRSRVVVDRSACRTALVGLDHALCALRRSMAQCLGLAPHAVDLCLVRRSDIDAAATLAAGHRLTDAPVASTHAERQRDEWTLRRATDGQYAHLTSGHSASALVSDSPLTNAAAARVRASAFTRIHALLPPGSPVTTQSHHTPDGHSAAADVKAVDAKADDRPVDEGFDIGSAASTAAAAAVNLSASSPKTSTETAAEVAPSVTIEDLTLAQLDIGHGDVLLINIIHGDVDD
jgi:hypothetical protein